MTTTIETDLVEFTPWRSRPTGGNTSVQEVEPSKPTPGTVAVVEKTIDVQEFIRRLRKKEKP